MHPSPESESESGFPSPEGALCFASCPPPSGEDTVRLAAPAVSRRRPCAGCTTAASHAAPWPRARLPWLSSERVSFFQCCYTNERVSCACRRTYAGGSENAPRIGRLQLELDVLGALHGDIVERVHHFAGFVVTLDAVVGIRLAAA
eukprot:358692-Chlamydomonas_euryale.AAC.5